MSTFIDTIASLKIDVLNERTRRLEAELKLARLELDAERKLMPSQASHVVAAHVTAVKKTTTPVVVAKKPAHVAAVKKTTAPVAAVKKPADAAAVVATAPVDAKKTAADIIAAVVATATAVAAKKTAADIVAAVVATATVTATAVDAKKTAADIVAAKKTAADIVAASAKKAATATPVKVAAAPVKVATATPAKVTAPTPVKVAPATPVKVAAAAPAVVAKKQFGQWAQSGNRTVVEMAKSIGKSSLRNSFHVADKRSKYIPTSPSSKDHARSYAYMKNSVCFQLANKISEKAHHYRVSLAKKDIQDVTEKTFLRDFYTYTKDAHTEESPNFLRVNFKKASPFDAETGKLLKSPPKLIMDVEIRIYGKSVHVILTKIFPNQIHVEITPHDNELCDEVITETFTESEILDEDNERAKSAILDDQNVSNIWSVVFRCWVHAYGHTIDDPKNPFYYRPAVSASEPASESASESTSESEFTSDSASESAYESGRGRSRSPQPVNKSRCYSPDIRAFTPPRPKKSESEQKQASGRGRSRSPQPMANRRCYSPVIRALTPPRSKKVIATEVEDAEAEEAEVEEAEEAEVKAEAEAKVEAEVEAEVDVDVEDADAENAEDDAEVDNAATESTDEDGFKTVTRPKRISKKRTSEEAHEDNAE